MEEIFHKALEINLPRSYCHESRKKCLSNQDKKICQPNSNKIECICHKKICETDPNKIDCICHKTNILVRPADFEETCFIFDTVKSIYGISSNVLLSLKDHVTEIIYPDSKNYDFYRLNYNHRFNFYPIAIVRAHNTDDIVKTINFCRETGIPIRARGGAHCYQPASLVNFGIVLDQRPRNKIVKINKQKSTVKIQAGALLGPVVSELSSKNLLIPTGTCVTNGLAGLTLGGGIGFALREYGLTMDQLVEMKAVLANGQVIKINDNINSDLYWALKGAGGGNFGIVTDFIFKYREVSWVTIFTMNFKFEDTKKIFKKWQEWAPYTATKLTSELDVHNKFQPVIVTGQLLPGKNRKADQKKLFKLIEPLIALGLHTDISIKTMNLSESYEYFGEGSYARPLFFYNKSDFNFEPLPDKAIDTIIYYMSLLDKTQSFHKTEVNALGGNFGKIANDATAFPSRNAIHWLQYTSLWDTTSEEDRNIQWLKKYYKAMRPYFPLKRKYVNALDYDTSPIQALKSYYGPNLPELIKIKEKYDPTNFFHFEQSVPTVKEFYKIIKH